MDDRAPSLYRIFEIQCSKKQLEELSEWLNEHLDFEGGEDFNKLADHHMTLCETVPDICISSRKAIALYLTWAAERIAEIGDKSTRTQNRLRLMRNMAKKIKP